MLRLAGLAVALAVLVPVLFAYAATFNLSYEGGGVIVVPIEDVVTGAADTPTAGGAGTSGALSREGAGATPEPEPTPPIADGGVPRTPGPAGEHRKRPLQP